MDDNDDDHGDDDGDDLNQTIEGEPWHFDHHHPSNLRLVTAIPPLCNIFDPITLKSVVQFSVLHFSGLNCVAKVLDSASIARSIVLLHGRLVLQHSIG